MATGGARVDAVVLGAGIVGVSAALHLQARGLSVAIVDNRGVASGASFGNAGLIAAHEAVPYGFRPPFGQLIRYASNRSPAARYRPADLPAAAGWLWRHWRASRHDRLHASGEALRPLFARSRYEFEALVDAAGVASLVRPGGWIDLYRDPAAFAAASREAEDHGGSARLLGPMELKEAEPRLSGDFAGGLHFTDAISVSDPAGIVAGFARLFEARGGTIQTGDARSLTATGDRWTVATDQGLLVAGMALIALGAWSDDVFRPLGYRIPLRSLRGYHVSFASGDELPMRRPLVDVDNGFVVTPMRDGIRLTGGVEIAGRDAPPSYRQIRDVEAIARAMLPLGKRSEGPPWMGRRPCLPDLRPVIGPAPRHPGLWFSFGHAHHGMTLGAVSGRLVADMMTGAPPFCDPSPFRADRFA